MKCFFLYFYVAMKKLLQLSILFTLVGCASDDRSIPIEEEEVIVIDDDPNNIRILALGDSYTSGHNVCDTCGFPEQLTDSLRQNLNPEYTYDLNVIAELGLTTSNLLTLIDRENPSNNHDLVTLLTGVNNQFQHIPFRTFFEEFPRLVNKAISLAKNDASNVIVISIPDYYYTTFGQGVPNQDNISEEIDSYNDYIEFYCNEFGITFINITDITRLGLTHPELVSIDGLNPSELAYTKFVERILPAAIAKIE